jgi:hypothetical protein
MPANDRGNQPVRNTAIAPSTIDNHTAFRDRRHMRTATPSPSTSLDSPRWNAVDFMVDFNSREKRLGLLTETFAWVASVAFFRRAESETLYVTEPGEVDRRYHKTILAALLAEGERVLSRLHKAGGLPENLDGIKTEDIDATVEELRYTQAQWYGDMTPERRAQILKEVFDVPAS